MWRQLDQEDYDAVSALRDAVLGSLPDSDFYVREDDEEMFVRGHLNVFGESLGFFDGDDLVAYLALTTDLVASGEDIEFAACAPTLPVTKVAPTTVAVWLWPDESTALAPFASSSCSNRCA